MLPENAHGHYELNPNNDVLGKGIRYYVERIAQENGLLIAKGESGLMVTSILSVLKLLRFYGDYYASEPEVSLLPGMITEVTFSVEDKLQAGGQKDVIRAKVTLVSEDPTDYLFYVRSNVR